MSEYKKPVKVTITDPETGAVLEEKTVSNDYLLVTQGSRYLKSIQVMGSCHILYVSKEKRNE